MTISIGVADVIAADNLEHWFKLADSALYLAKRNGRNRVEVATPSAGGAGALSPKPCRNWR